MKNQLLNLLILLILFYGFPQLLNGQYTKVEQISMFSTRVVSPIEMDVQRSSDKIIFSANNKSFYPYDFVLTFSIFQNLSPRMFEYKMKLYPGKSRLFDLDIVNKNESPQYQYSYRYTMLITSSPDLSYPYLIPLRKGLTVRCDSTTNENQTIFYLNRFRVATDDTVYAVRKGTVTALPDNNTDIDRIFSEPSLEVLHKDGTVAVYVGLDHGHQFLKPGQVVYPGQPVGIIGTKGTLTVYLFGMVEGSKLKTIEFNYSDQNESLISSRQIKGTKVFHPINIIKKELTRKELTKMEKGKLY